MLHSLLRLTEPCGHIYIDGVDVTQMGLQDLREKISVIPQVSKGKKNHQHQIQNLVCTERVGTENECIGLALKIFSPGSSFIQWNNEAKS